jgi:hypothetical protein
MQCTIAPADIQWPTAWARVYPFGLAYSDLAESDWRSTEAYGMGDQTSMFLGCGLWEAPAPFSKASSVRIERVLFAAFADVECGLQYARPMAMQVRLPVSMCIQNMCYSDICNTIVQQALVRATSQRSQLYRLQHLVRYEAKRLYHNYWENDPAAVKEVARQMLEYTTAKQHLLQSIANSYV